MHHRDDLDQVQRELRDMQGVTVLLYDQTCAAEKRRRRKRGKFPDPAKRVVINELVCEGCGDCGVKSNCVSVAPLETEFGRKRTIDQSSCNKDYSCVNGFCPSFVTVEGGSLRKPKKAAAGEFPALPDPTPASAAEPYGILVTGIGGTGVVTIGALLGMAGHLEGKGVSVLDMAGLAQKNGAVVSHVRIADSPDQTLRDAHRRGRGAARARLRHPHWRELRRDRQDAERRDQGAGQHRAGDAGGFHAQRRPALPARARWSRKSRMRYRPATPSSSTPPSWPRD